MNPRSLLVGIGNTLRGDDGIGPLMVRRAAVDFGSSIEVREVHQLLPELAEVCSRFHRVLFVDACLDRNLRLEPVKEEGWPRAHHRGNPGSIVHGCWVWYGKRVEGWVLAVPGYHFEYGEVLSPEALAQFPSALDLVGEWLSNSEREGSACTKSG